MGVLLGLEVDTGIWHGKSQLVLHNPQQTFQGLCLIYEDYPIDKLSHELILTDTDSVSNADILILICPNKTDLHQRQYFCEIHLGGNGLGQGLLLSRVSSYS